MGSENYADRLSRRSFLGYAAQGAVVAVGVFGLDRLANACDKPPEHIQNLSLSKFKNALGKSRLEGMTEEGEKRLEEEWDDYSLKEKEFFYQVYTNPKKAYKKLSKKEKKEYREFNPNDIKETELKELQELVLWKIIPKNKKYSKSDKMMLFYVKKFSAITFPIAL
ncbi:MAG: twin-arginine translocation signal domain-containing protein [Nanoarchaeota archaeon]|nr:twin-arginine translocation signal domain-containing protein [Nanoarchaeota archaeon]